MNKLLKLSAASLLVFTGFSVNADTLSDVKSKGSLSCGVSTGTPGFSNPDSNGNWSGMDVDVCRAIAAATLGDDRKVKYVPLSAKERFTKLQAGEYDVLSRNTTWNPNYPSSSETQTKDQKVYPRDLYNLFSFR